MGTVQDSVSLRAEKAAQILSIPASSLLKILADEGIGEDAAGLATLDSPGTTIDDIAVIISGKSVEVATPGGLTATKQLKLLPAKAAAGVLKQAVAAQAKPAETSVTEVLAKALKDSRPIQQWEDEQLLQNFIETRGAEVEQELDRRAKHRKFVVQKDPATQNLKRYEPGKEVIDVPLTLELLRKARKQEVPGCYPVAGKFVMVYRITELNPQDRIVEICPICGEVLFNGYCEKCESTFVDIADEARAYVWLVAHEGKINADSVSDRKALLASASKGVEDMKQTWPSLAQKFEEMVLTSNLPKLRLIENRPTAVADPFHVDGNRTFGNRSY